MADWGKGRGGDAVDGVFTGIDGGEGRRRAVADCGKGRGGDAVDGVFMGVDRRELESAGGQLDKSEALVPESVGSERSEVVRQRTASTDGTAAGWELVEGAGSGSSESNIASAASLSDIASGSHPL